MLFVYIITIVVVAILFVLRWRYNSSERKGKDGEKCVAEMLSQLSSDYVVMNDVVLPTDRGTTQIDHVVISKYGLFAIETKNYGGEIYGDDNRKEWTQLIVNEVSYNSNPFKTYTYVTKNRFYNPVKQSLGHVIEIKKFLKNYPYVPIVSIVVFVGDAILKNVHCRNHVIYGEQLLEIIQKYKNTYLSDSDMENVVNLLQQRNVRDLIDNKTHVANLYRSYLQLGEIINSGNCPKCGGVLVERSGVYGKFYGCSNYPRCKFTVRRKCL